eukprot:Platyproteum_vivax@DN6941_c0_g2_i1.p1
MPPVDNSKNSQKTEESGVNVKVLVRCRPPSSQEQADPSQFTVVQTKVNTKEVIVSQTIPGRKCADQHSKTFTFDGVCNPYTTQEEIFNSHISPVVDEVLQGFNCTIFAYGQTGTGKTYTMEGDMKEYLKDDVQLTHHAGLIPRSVQAVFDRLEAQNAEYSVRVSYLEIYNEELCDLLTENKQQLRIFDELSNKRGLAVDKLEEIPVNNPTDIFSIICSAVQKRKTAETLLNKASSRSHCIFTLVIHMKESVIEGEDVLKVGKLNLVDLAGSENIGRSGAIKNRAKEAGMINQSLLTLGRVITALVEHTPYVPYRDSKLTRLLQESLGGKTKTCIIATISPSSLCLDESLSTLDYAHRAKNIRNKPEVNQRMSKQVIIREMNVELEKIRMELQSARDKDGVFLPLEKFNEMQSKLSGQNTDISQLQDAMDGLAKQKKEIEDLFDSVSKKLSDEKEKHKKTEAVLDKTADELKCKISNLKSTQNAFGKQQLEVRGLKEAEDKLIDKVGGLSINLKSAAMDVNNLHSKIATQKEIAASNLRHHMSYEESLENFCDEFHNKAQKYCGLQESKIEELVRYIETQASLNKEQKCQHEHNCGELHGQIATNTEAVLGVLNEAVDRQKKQLEDAKEAVERNRHEEAQKLENTAQTLNEYLNVGLVELLHNEAEETQTFMKTKQEIMKKSYESLQKHQNEGETKINNSKEEVEAAVITTLIGIQKLKTSAEVQCEKACESITTKTEDFMDKMSKFMQENTAELCSQLKAQQTEIISRLDQIEAESLKLKKVLVLQIEEVATQQKVAVETAITCNETLQESLKAFGKASESCKKSQLEFVEQKNEQLVNSIEGVKSQASVDCETIKRSLQAVADFEKNELQKPIVSNIEKLQRESGNSKTAMEEWQKQTALEYAESQERLQMLSQDLTEINERAFQENVQGNKRIKQAT